VKTPDKPPIVCLISLGCAKNTVDSECLLGSLVSDGILIAEYPEDADICMVNTCGFIHDAREEAQSVLTEISNLKTTGKLKAVIALGCLVERVTDCPELESFLDHADIKAGFADYPHLPQICKKLTKKTSTSAGPVLSVSEHDAVYRLPDSFMQFLSSPRARIGSTHTAYLKISEGCSNPCRFCSIPRIRGQQISRPIEDLLNETKTLIASSAREINLIAQDTTSYGKDLYGKIRLSDLLTRLKKLDDTVWYRLIYAYPRFITEELLKLLSSTPCLCPYLDLPLQHITDRILKSMGRGMTKAETMHLLNRIVTALPKGALRTTFIVGYPGETDSEFEELLQLIKEGRFTHVGVFTYSQEPGTAAARLADDIPQDLKEARRDALMEAQLEISRKRLSSMVGTTMEVMIDGFTEEKAEHPGVTAVGRTQLDAPEVDGLVLLRGDTDKCEPGDRFDVKIVDSLDYDLVGELLSS